jgi:hypothetical protein
MTAATMDSHQIWSKSGICEKRICVAPNRIMYGLLELLHGLAWPLVWKHPALLMACMLMEEAMVYPMATPTRFAYWMTPQKVTLTPPRLDRTASM